MSAAASEAEYNIDPWTSGCVVVAMVFEADFSRRTTLRLAFVASRLDTQRMPMSADGIVREDTLYLCVESLISWILFVSFLRDNLTVSLVPLLIPLFS